MSLPLELRPARAYRRWLGLVTVLATLSGCRTTAPVQVAPHASELRFSGRVDREDPNGPRLAWGGTSLVVRFTGTSLGLRLLDLPKPGRPAPNRFRFSVDGEPFRDLYVGQGPMLYRLVEGLPWGEHVLRLEKETEPLVGETQLIGLELDPGARLLPAPPAPSRRLEFVGDSNVTGYGVEGEDAKCSFSVETQRSSLAWPALLSRALDAEASIVAYSGKGVVLNWADSPQPTMPQLYERTLPHRDDSRWDFQTWVPDAVFIQLGGNDFSQRHPGEERFRSAYQALVERIRQRSPRAHIICLLSASVSDGWPNKEDRARTHLRGLISGTVEALRQQGDDRVHFVEVSPATPEEGHGCDWHYSHKTHQRVAAQLTPLLREWLGWK